MVTDDYWTGGFDLDLYSEWPFLYYEKDYFLLLEFDIMDDVGPSENIYLCLAAFDIGVYIK